MTQPQRIPRDEGTPELRAKRFAVVGRGDPNMAFCELGRLCEQGKLDSDMPTARRMYDAGMTLLSLWRAVYPSSVGSTLGQFMPSGSADFDSDTAEYDLKDLTKYFGPTRSMILHATRDCVVYDKVLEGGKLKKLRKGLNLIIDWQKARRG